MKFFNPISLLARIVYKAITRQQPCRISHLFFYGFAVTCG
jgi:hypothetical protein